MKTRCAQSSSDSRGGIQLATALPEDRATAASGQNPKWLSLNGMSASPPRSGHRSLADISRFMRARCGPRFDQPATLWLMCLGGDGGDNSLYPSFLLLSPLCRPREKRELMTMNYNRHHRRGVISGIGPRENMRCGSVAKCCHRRNRVL
jgi:hypothetical protein